VIVLTGKIWERCLPKIGQMERKGGHVVWAGRVVVRMSELGLKGPGFDPRAVPKSECMFVNIYHY